MGGSSIVYVGPEDIYAHAEAGLAPLKDSVLHMSMVPGLTAPVIRAVNSLDEEAVFYSPREIQRLCLPVDLEKLADHAKIVYDTRLRTPQCFLCLSHFKQEDLDAMTIEVARCARYAWD